MYFVKRSALVGVPFAMRVNAGMMPTGQAVSNLVRQENREKVSQFMARQDVKAEFAKFGVDANEAAQRVAALSDSEIQKLAGEMGRAPAGADVIVISLGTVLLVILILILLGKL